MYENGSRVVLGPFDMYVGYDTYLAGESPVTGSYLTLTQFSIHKELVLY